ncbi:MAG: hypothetical protein J0G96_07180 [Flavobacteriia bacterium]|nr:hypothetical protein [Flavobacteriia bacterium]OJX36651.1 MAG: hypothetical protein BGO87_12690 [Flavobacteriia bacterium 40-80]
MKKEHISRLEEFFKVYPEETECILFADGQIFTRKNEGYANQFHQQSGLKFETVKKSEIESETKVLPLVKEGDLSAKTNKELAEFGKTLGLDLNPKSKKAELLQAIADASKPQSDDPAATEEETEDVSEEDYKPVQND